MRWTVTSTVPVPAGLVAVTVEVLATVTASLGPLAGRVAAPRAGAA